MDEEPNTPEASHQQQEEQRIMSIHAVKSFVLALIIVVVAIVLLIVLVLTKKDPEKKEEAELVTSVRVESVVMGNHQVKIDTQGVVRSLHQVQLASEVGGRVLSKSPDLVEGAVVKKGQVLLEIDTADYKAAQARAESALAEAKLALEQEEAMSEQAAIDWKKLGRGEPSDLVLRKPQRVAAQARVESAQAELMRAKRDVERASIRAPFDARVRMASAEVGAVLAPGTPVADLYSTDELEVRLPFSLLDYGYLRGEDQVELELTATLGGEVRTWPAVLDRIDGEVQRSTLSAYGLAKVKPNADGELPPVGLFVEAVVPGKIIEDVVVLPRSAVRGSNEVWVVEGPKPAKNDKGKVVKRAPYRERLTKREITILRSSREELVVRGNFQPGDMLVLTRLAAPMTGMKVEAIKEEVETPEEGEPTENP